MKRGLSGIYFRSKDEETKKWDNIVFEELPEKEQDVILEEYDKEALKRLAKMLANTIKVIGNTMDLKI